MQSRKASAVESIMNVGSGFIVAMLIWQLIANPLYGYNVSLLDNLGLTTIFTSVSLMRSYLWRRYFNKRDTKCS